MFENWIKICGSKEKYIFYAVHVGNIDLGYYILAFVYIFLIKIGKKEEPLTMLLSIIIMECAEYFLFDSKVKSKIIKFSECQN